MSLNRKIKITILTVGARSGVEPFIALGCGLLKADYDVKVVAHEEFKPLVEKFNLEFAPVAGHAEVNESIKPGAQPDEFYDSFRKEASPFVEQAIIDYSKACEGTDFILSSAITLHLAHYISELIDVPLIFCSDNPAGETKAFPHLFSEPIGGPKFIQSRYNLTTHKIATEVIWRMIRKELPKAWNKTMPKQNFAQLDPLADAFKRKPPLILYAYSPIILPKPADWSIVQFVTGYWWLPKNENYTPTQDLVDFISNGTPPIYVDFGSMTDPKDEILNNIVVPAIKQLNERVIIFDDGTDLSMHIKDPDVCIINNVEFKWLFPKLKAIIHHGQSRITGLGAWAGCPNLIVTSVPDQKFWAKRMHNLGAIPKPIHKTELTIQLFIERLKEALETNKYKSKYQEISRKIKKENGVSTAVDLINQFIAYKFN